MEVIWDSYGNACKIRCFGLVLGVVVAVQMMASSVNSQAVQEYFIACDPDSFAYIYNHFSKDYYIHVTFTHAGQTWSRVRMRIRGDSSREYPKKSLKLEFDAEPIEPESFAPEESIVVPPQVRASSMVRQVLSEMLKPVQADVVLEEEVSIQNIDLYYRPIYAFEYHWTSKDKRAVVEFDGLTGDMRHGGKALRQQLSHVFTRDVLFDVGADMVGMLIPGGGVAIKVAKAVADSKGTGGD